MLKMKSWILLYSYFSFPLISQKTITIIILGHDGVLDDLLELLALRSITEVIKDFLGEPLRGFFN